MNEELNKQLALAKDSAGELHYRIHRAMMSVSDYTSTADQIAFAHLLSLCQEAAALINKIAIIQPK
jgi:hypothetical protein